MGTFLNDQSFKNVPNDYVGGLGPRVGDPHALTPANKGIAKTPPGTSVIDVEVRPR